MVLQNNKQLFLDETYNYLSKTLFKNRYYLTREYFDNELTMQKLFELIIDYTDFFEVFFTFNSFLGVYSYDEYMEKHNLKKLDNKKECIKYTAINNIYIQYHKKLPKHKIVDEFSPDALFVQQDFYTIKVFVNNMFTCYLNKYDTNIESAYNKKLYIAFLKDNFNFDNFEDFKFYLQSKGYLLLINKKLDKYCGIYKKIDDLQIVKVSDFYMEQESNFENIDLSVLYQIINFLSQNFNNE